MKSWKSVFHVSLAIACIAIAAAGCQSTAERDASARVETLADDGYYDLGAFHRRVATSSAEAQRWFDRGLLLCYGFNHEEAIRCFERAIEADPECAMAYWGVAYAYGPNINNTMMPPEAEKAAVAAVREAKKRVRSDEPLERALIDALATRYALPGEGDRSALDKAYVAAMREVYEDNRDDSDIIALFSEALMMLRPWRYWSPEGEPAPETPEIVATIEEGLAKFPDHPALCHFYIHTMEASPYRAKAMPAADRLGDYAPGSGHLVHMPSHIYIGVGDYPAAVLANQKAISADLDFVEREGPMNFYTLYRVHNYHFLTYAAMFDGRSEMALTSAREMVEQIPDPLLAQIPFILEAFLPIPLHVMIRFGQWDAVLEEPKPQDGRPFELAVWHYARGIAYATLDRVAEAEAERAAFRAVVPKVPENYILFQNACKDILAIAGHMLDGEIEYRKGNYDAAFASLREAVRHDDELNYDEPWGWMQPARHALGALLLEQGRVAEAASVYEKDLERYPNNGWTLRGLAECYERLGKSTLAAATEARFVKAWERADVTIRASCFCAIGDA